MIAIKMQIICGLANSLMTRSRTGQVALAADAGGRRVEHFIRDRKLTKGAQADAERKAFNDSGWQSVRLPHGVGAAVGVWFFAHRHGQLRGLADAAKQKITEVT